MFGHVSCWDEGLNEAQVEAAAHGDTALIVVAGAGTGKTKTLIARVARLLECGVPADRILLLTYTRRAADEMVSRAATLAGVSGDQRPRGGTFHAVAYRHIAAYAEVLNLPGDFAVLDPAGACDLMDLLRGDHDLAGTATRFPRSWTLVEIYSRCINNQLPVRQMVPDRYPWCEPHIDSIAELFRDFTARKRRSALLDFDDLLLGWRALLSDDALGPRLADRFSYVLVDEFQDTNSVQADIVMLLAPDGRGLTVVGDEAQAIYGFRGSDPGHLRRLVETYPDSTVVRLEHNFRSCQRVLDVANVVRPRGEDTMELKAERGPGRQPTLVHCYDTASEARTVATNVLDAHERGVSLRDQAVLVRASHHSSLVEIELSVRKIPYRKYGGLRFLEAAHVKDFVAAARMLDNPHDAVAWYRLLRLHRHIGPSRARELVATLDGSAADPLERWPEIVAAAPARARTELSDTCAGLVEARQQSSPGVRADAVVRVVAPLVAGRYANPSSRVADLERLVRAASAVEDFSAWLADLTLDPPASTGDFARDPRLDEDYVVISTIHSAKGLEWSVVHLPHLVDGAMPSDMALSTPDGVAEEQRLLYVAVTRAKDELYLYAPLRVPHHRRALDDKHSYALMSRFLTEDVQAALTLVESAPPRANLEGSGGARVVIDLDPLWA